MRRNTKIVMGMTIGVLVSVSLFLLSKRLRLSAFKRNLVSNAKREWHLWGKPLNVGGKTIEKGASECTPIYKDRVGEYWKKGTGRNLDGCDRSVPWSAAFISFIMKKSGAGSDFRYSSAHNEYIKKTIADRKADKKAPFLGYRLNEKPVAIGDLICYGREGQGGYDSTSSYKSHCDIVVNVNKLKKEAEVIGGNVSQGVTKRIVSIDRKGYLTDPHQDWFAIVKNYK